MTSRDIRLSTDEIIALRDLCRARIRELEKRLERSSYDGKPGMKDAVLTELSLMRELDRTMEHNREQIARQLAELVLPKHPSHDSELLAMHTARNRRRWQNT